MNIFVLDSDPETAARDHCDKHIVKMVTETAQLICTAVGGGEGLYRPTHRHHPVTKWVAHTRANLDWTISFGRALAAEYTRRYGRTHKAEAVIERASTYANLVPDGPLTPHAQAMPEQYRHVDAVTAYREFYRGEKASFAVWAHTPTPAWWTAARS